MLCGNGERTGCGQCCVVMVRGQAVVSAVW